MPLETATYISDLVSTNPVATDGLNQADDHLRLIKSVLLTTFPDVEGAVSASHTDISNGYVPVGGIILWSGSVASIPTHWALCNGANGTPDLRDRFVVGAGSTYAVDATGGSLTTTTDGAHTHGGVTGSDGAHTHSGATGGHAITVDELPKSDTDTLTILGTTVAVASGSDTATEHTHTISSDGVHTHTITSGGDHTHTATPPYYALAYIMRTA